ncbi:TPA: phage protein GemA/Gp16 family protein, partial [Neisseria meningitidis]
MRRALIAKIKIAQKELGLDDGTYRAVLERVTDKRSCADMDVS